MLQVYHIDHSAISRIGSSQGILCNPLLNSAHKQYALTANKDELHRAHIFDVSNTSGLVSYNSRQNKKADNKLSAFYLQK